MQRYNVFAQMISICTNRSSDSEVNKQQDMIWWILDKYLLMQLNDYIMYIYKHILFYNSS